MKQLNNSHIKQVNAKGTGKAPKDRQDMKTGTQGGFLAKAPCSSSGSANPQRPYHWNDMDNDKVVPTYRIFGPRKQDGEKEQCIGRIDSKEHADFLCHAGNCFPGLVGALEKIHAALHDSGGAAVTREALDRICREEIALATGGGTLNARPAIVVEVESGIVRAIWFNDHVRYKTIVADRDNTQVGNPLCHYTSSGTLQWAPKDIQTDPLVTGKAVQS